MPFLKRISEAQGRLRELVVAEKRPSANERAAVPEVSVNPGAGGFSAGFSRKKRRVTCRSIAGLFDEAIIQRDR